MEYVGEKQKRIEILGVNVDNYDINSVKSKIFEWIDTSVKRIIVTVNPEFIVDSLSNEQFKRVLNSADLSLIDGVGIKFAAKFLEDVKERGADSSPIISALIGLKVGLFGILFPKYLSKYYLVPGSDLVQRLLSELGSTGRVSFYLIGTKYQNGEESAELAFKALLKDYPNISIAGTTSGRREIEPGKFEDIPLEEIRSKMQKDLLEKSIEVVDIVLVAFGHVRQELWISKHINMLPGKIFIGVGASLDFISGKKLRAPVILRALKLEWLFRLLSEPTPQRFKRIYKAVITFPIKVFFSSFSK